MVSPETGLSVNIMKSLNDFREEEMFCDVTLIVQGVCYPAHRNVLAANSEFFKALFANEMREKSDKVVYMDDFEPKIFEGLLNYMYCGKVPINTNNALDLAIGADFMFLTELRQRACEFLTKSLRSENCLFLLSMAEKYNFREIRDAAQIYILENYVAVSTCREFLNLTIEQFLAMIPSDELVAREEDIFESVVRWTKHSVETRKKHFSALFSHIRLIHLARCFLINEVQEEGLVKSEENCLQRVNAAKEFFSLPSKAAKNKDKLCHPRTCQTAILLVGGWEENHVVTASTTLFIPSIKQCFMLSPLLMPRKNHGTTVHEGLAYAVGGTSNNSKTMRSVEMYDPKTNSWSSVMPLHKEVSGVGLAVYRDCLYAVGGHDSEGQPLNTVQCYNPKQNKWEYVALMNASRTRHCVVGATFLYSFGGYGSEDFLPLSSAEFYDGSSDSWKDMAPMNQRRSDACAVSVGVKLYVIGGEDILESPIKLGSCEVYNPANNMWTMLKPLFEPRSHAGAAVIKKKIYILGGIDKHCRELRSVECYDMEQVTWEMIATLPVALEGLGCCSITVPGELMSTLV